MSITVLVAAEAFWVIPSILELNSVVEGEESKLRVTPAIYGSGEAAVKNESHHQTLLNHRV
jgi:hypothetical protein